MADNRVSAQNYYVVQGWMVSELGLKGNELAVYAIIYGFSQIEGTWFNGSLNYLSSWTNLSRQSIINILKSLVKRGLIEKEEQTIRGVKFCSYRAICSARGSQKTLLGVKDFDGGSQKTLLGVVKNFDQGSQKTLPNNIRDKIDDNISDKTGCLSDLSEEERRIAYIFCKVFNANNISHRLLDTIRNTLQAGVSPERMESLIRSAKKHHPREPESYIAAGLKSLRKSTGQDKRVTLKPEEKPLADWEQDWLQEFKAMQHSTQT